MTSNLKQILRTEIQWFRNQLQVRENALAGIEAGGEMPAGSNISRVNGSTTAGRTARPRVRARAAPRRVARRQGQGGNGGGGTIPMATQNHYEAAVNFMRTKNIAELPLADVARGLVESGHALGGNPQRHAAVLKGSITQAVQRKKRDLKVAGDKLVWSGFKGQQAATA